MHSFVYVSQHSSGDIAGYLLDSDTGRLTPLAPTAARPMVMPLAAGRAGKFIHAVIRTKPYAVLTYHVDRKTGELFHVGAAPLPESMVGAVVDRSGRWLLSAAYGGNALCVQAIGDDGRIAEIPAHFGLSGGVKPHAMCLDASNRVVYVPHLGSDEVRIYTFEEATGALAPATQSHIELPPGTGPRHAVLSPDERFLYVLGQLTGVVAVFARDPANGRLESRHAMAAVPPGSGLSAGQPRPPSDSLQAAPPETDRVWCADIQIAPNGRFIYTTERARSTISIMATDAASGHLRLVDHVATEQQPRAIGIDPEGRFLIASGEASPLLSLYGIDSYSGALELRQRVPAGVGANWVLFVRASGAADTRAACQLEKS